MENDEKRLVMDIPRHIHNDIKKIAAGHGCSIKRWVLNAIVNQILKETNTEREHE